MEPLPLPLLPVLPPDGNLRKLAEHFYRISPRPVREIALVAAIGVYAGLAGRAFNVYGSGLNQYLVLLAPTGTGKESIASALDLVSNSLNQPFSSSGFLGPGDIASGQALLRHLAHSLSIVSVLGEFALKLQQICHPRANSAEQSLKRVLLDLYGKSGAGAKIQPTVYANKENDIPFIRSPAYSFIGESTPSSFYQLITPTLISQGLVSRILIIQYEGLRPPLNKQHLVEKDLPEELASHLQDLNRMSSRLNQSNEVVDIPLSTEAEEFADQLDRDCDSRINATGSDTIRHLWNRVHLRTLKLAALLALSRNLYSPEISLEDIEWSAELTVAATLQTIEKLLSIDTVHDSLTEENETPQVLAVRQAIRKYLNTEKESLSEQQQQFREKGYVSYSYLSSKTHNLKCFQPKSAFITEKKMLLDAIAHLSAVGLLAQAQRFETKKQFGFSGALYRILG